MLDKEIFVKNIKEISKDMSNKEIAEIAGCAPGTISKYHNSKYPDFYSVEMLMKLSKRFNVSIDWLMGMDAEQNKTDCIGIKELCRIISTLFENGDCLFRPATHKEDCFDWIEDTYNPQDSHFDHEKRQNNYSALIFPDYIKPKDEDEYEIFSQAGNNNTKNNQINMFIQKMLKADGLLKADGIDLEMYHDLIEKYISDLPDK